MTTLTQLGVAYSPVNMPNLNAQVRAHTIYHHTGDRISPTELNLSITVWLQIIEAKGGTVHKIVNATTKFHFKIEDEQLSETVLFKAWEKAFQNLYVEFIRLLIKLGMPKMPVDGPNQKELSVTLAPILKMFNDTHFIPGV
jgi:hypothetical protein